MATITKGKTFVNGELVTPEKLHQLVDAATLSPLVNADIASNAAIADTKLATISTANKVAQSAVTNLATDLAGKAASSHTHDDRYYTETEMNTLLAGKQASGSYAPATGIAPSAITGTAVITSDSRLSDARTPTAHNHDASAINAGTLAIARIPTGTTSSTVCIGNDSRLSDARTPTAHTHDDRYYTESEIDTKLSGLPVSGHTHAATDITSGTLANARTTATAENTANTIVARDTSGNIKGQDLISERFSPDGNCGVLQFRKGMGTASNPANVAGSNANLGIISFNGYSFGNWEQQAAVVVNTITTDSAQRPVGNFQIQTRSLNGNFVSRLNINGDGNAVFSGTCSATVLFQTSDLEEKENINYDFKHGLEKVKSLKPVQFDFKTGPKGNLGFIAQDLVKEIPDAVISYNKVISENGIEQEVERLGLKEGHLVAVLVKAVQELAARVEALEAK